MNRDEPPRPAQKPRPKLKFVRDTRALIGRSSKESSRWMQGAMMAVVALVGLTFFLGELGLLRRIIPFSDSYWFWAGVVALPIVGMVVIAVGGTLFEQRKAASWSQTTGRIVRSGIETRRHQFSGDAEKVENVPAVEYEFTAGGREIRGNRISIGEDSGGANTAATLDRYPVGATVTVYYDPDDPTSCVLERDMPKDLSVIGCLAALAIFALFGGAIYLLAAHGPAFVRANFPKADNAEFAVAVTGFGLLALMMFFAMRRYAQQAAGWPSVRGQVVTSEVESYRKTEDGRTTTSYRPVVEYVYTVRGREYRCNQITLMVQTGGSEVFAQKIRAKYPAGAAVTVRYDPANPGTAALESPGGAIWLPLFVVAVCFALAAWQLGLFS